MKKYNQIKGKGLPYILGEALLYNLFIIILIFLVNSYELSNLLNVSLIVVNIYELHYIFLYTTLHYVIEGDKIYIRGIWGFKNDVIKISCIEGYRRGSGDIKGVKLYGYGKNNFALGKSIIDDVGTTKMYVTSSKDIIYLKVGDICYAVSPENCNDFEEELIKQGVKSMAWELSFKKNINLYKDKKFLLPLIIVTIIISILILNPFILYLYGKLPAEMPLSFDSGFNAVKIGTGKQFAFKQMAYGVLNMALLFCMYYASYFYAKYDKKSAYKFIYVSLVASVLFLFIQFKILITF
ncbi:PH domain-containing protein [Clostridium malenominatum]|uniref:PH domain-containing protein n=1 Tax=Clostridium malenominatum TaxID=1539 RepID=A0ABP3TVX2_9CLOT